MKGRMKFGIVGVVLVFVFLMGMTLSPETSSAAPPVVKTVRWVATNALIPHDTWSGKSIRLKGTCDQQGANFQYTWDFGDGSPVANGTVTNMYVIEASHAYTGAVGTVFTARLTVQNTGTGETGSKEYYVKIETQSLPVEVNVAIDEGLWYLHKTMTRGTSGSVPIGYWNSGNAGSGYYSVSAANVNAFEANGFLKTGAADDPYTETVSRGLNRLFEYLAATGIPSSQTNPRGTFNPDSNGNGLGIYLNQSYPFYQGGQFVDAIVASGTPNAIAPLGPANVVGRTYKDIVQDMIDYYSYCQYDGASGSLALGGWRYNCGDFPDNSACQWVSIGIIAAMRQWGIILPNIMLQANVDWLTYTQVATGGFGYTSPGYYPWGPFATTPSGMVQMVMNGIGRGNVGTPSWDKAETFIRNNFCNTGGAGNAIKDYYYGLLSFTKSMLLHNPPIAMLQSSTAGVNPIDWYAAQASAGAPCDGVARTLVADQNPAGYWFGHNNDGNQYYFETAWAIIMLNRTIFTGGAPVAVAKAIPSPAVAFQTITLDGSGSFHQDPARSIVGWDWDLTGACNNFTLTGPQVQTSFNAVGAYPVCLKVTDDSTPTPLTATSVISVIVSTPPIAPTADAGGPYNFCTNRTPWFLDGTGSVNPDEGQHQPGAYPGDTIYGNPNQFAWELNGNGSFDDRFGQTPDVTGFWGVGSYLIQLKVTDTTATSFPASGMSNLSSTSSAQVVVRAGTDPACVCVSDLTARPKLNKAELRWTWKAGANHYNVYRGTANGGPYTKIATVSTGTGFYLDLGPLAIGTTYYYVVREAALNDNELCQSNQASARPALR